MSKLVSSHFGIFFFFTIEKTILPYCMKTDPVKFDYIIINFSTTFHRNITNSHTLHLNNKIEDFVLQLSQIYCISYIHSTYIIIPKKKKKNNRKSHLEQGAKVVKKRYRFQKSCCPLNNNLRTDSSRVESSIEAVREYSSRVCRLQIKGGGGGGGENEKLKKMKKKKRRRKRGRWKVKPGFLEGNAPVNPAHKSSTINRVTGWAVNRKHVLRQSPTQQRPSTSLFHANATGQFLFFRLCGRFCMHLLCI